MTHPPVVSPTHPGAVSLERQPWMVQPLRDALNPNVRQMWLVMCTQTGKTTTLLFAQLLLAVHDPKPSMWVLPNVDVAKRVASTRLIPMLEANVPDLLPDDRDRVTLAHIELKTMPIYVVSAGSAAQLSSSPVAYIFCDEEAKYAQRDKTESHPVLLARERQKTLPRRLMIHASTPTAEDSVFWMGWKTSRMAYWWMPCPHCGGWMRFEFTDKTLRWPHGVSFEEIERDAWYECPHCGGHITEEMRQGMIAAGEWRCSNERAAEADVGYHLNSMYSHFTSFGEVAVAFLQAKALGSAGLQNFYNSWLGEPWMPYLLAVGEAAVRSCMMPGFKRGHLPAGVKIYYLIATYDVHQAHNNWMLTAMCEHGAQYVVEWGEFLGTVTDEARGMHGIADHFDTLEVDGMKPLLGFVDSGYDTRAVYAECMKRPGRLFPTKGSAVRSGAGTLSEVTLRDPGAEGLNLYVYADLHAKHDLYAGSIAKKDGFAFYLPDNADAEVIAGHVGQQLVHRKTGYEWQAVKDDHYGDCSKLARVSWWLLRDAFEPMTFDTLPK